MKTLRLLACVAAIAIPSACSSNHTSAASQDGADAGHDASDPPDGGGPDAATAGDARGSSTGACTTSGACPTDSPCCLRTSDAGAQCAPDPQIPQTCLCEKGSDCASGACAPAVDSSGNPTGPYVCVPDDGSPYQGCLGVSSCTAPYCCVTDKHGNLFCSKPCTSDSTCGSGHCDAFDFSASSCTGATKACGI